MRKELLKHYYDIDSLKAFESGTKAFIKDTLKTHSLKDNRYGGLVQQESLYAIDPQILEQQYPELSFLNLNIDANTIGGYARKIRTLSVDGQGEMKRANSRSQGGKITVTRGLGELMVYEYRAFSEWSDSEVAENALDNVNLQEVYLRQHTRKYEELIDTVGYIGDLNEDPDAIGLLNYPWSFSNAGSAVESLSAQQQYDAISSVIKDQLNLNYISADDSNAHPYQANTIVMPPRVMNELSRDLLHPLYNENTVIAALKRNHPRIRFITTLKAEKTTNNGYLSDSVVLAFSNNQQALKFRVPVPFYLYPIFYRSASTLEVESMARLAGIDVFANSVGKVIKGL